MGEDDREGAATTVPPPPVAAEHALAAPAFAIRGDRVVAFQETVPIERAGLAAERTPARLE